MSSNNTPVDLDRQIRRLQRTNRGISTGTWIVFAGAVLFSAGNIHDFARAHHTPDPAAWLLAPVIDVALFVALTADSALGRLGVEVDGFWPSALRLFTGLATWLLNAWESLPFGHAADPAGIALHSATPVTLVLLAEAGPAYRAAFAKAIDKALATAVQEPVPVAISHTQRERDTAGTPAPAGLVVTETWPPLPGVEADAIQVPGPRTETGSETQVLAVETVIETDRERLGGTETSPETLAGGPEEVDDQAGEDDVINADDVDELAELTPTERARTHWDRERAAGRTPSGAELDRIAGTSNYGRKLRNKWLDEAGETTGAGSRLHVV